VIRVVFRSRGVLHFTLLPVQIDPETPTHVLCHAVNPVSLNIAPLGDPPIVVQPGTPMRVLHTAIH
jgi:hypothetical protein